MSDNNDVRNTGIPRGYLPEDTIARRKWVKSFSGIDLDDSVSDKVEDLQGIIENHIGFLKIPMAIVGPMLLDGTYASGEFCVPVCTLEGTLALSMNRGMYASSLCGGTIVKHFRQELSRAPVFMFDNIKQSSEFQLWVSKNEKEIINAAESTTNHGKVIRIDQYTVQNYVVLDIVMDTSNAAGQNMVTLAAKVACEYIYKKTNQNYFLESNLHFDNS